MITAGIICEYNPFHLGHRRQLELVRQALGEETAIVCVMSGNYVQRGEPARWDKFTRARAAVACGADVVLELPVTCVLRSAEGFARGGVEILGRFGAEVLSFGAECGDGALLMELARRTETAEFSEQLREELNRGRSYAAARQAAMGPGSEILSQPNNILGLEYCRAILSLNSAMEPLAIRRTGDYHAAEADVQAPSATAVRSLYPDGPWQQYVPPEAVRVLQDAPWYDLAFGERAVLARLRAMTDGEWERCAHGSEGLWSKAMKAVRNQPDLESILQAVKSKRYPRTRLQRLLLCAYLGLSQVDLERQIPYVRILAVTQRGRPLLRRAKDLGALPLVNPGQTPTDQDYYALERRAADLYTLFAAPGWPASAAQEQSARLF